jgi:hypothetical protein
VAPVPFKSRAQRRKFAELLMKGEISEKTYEDWNRDTGRAKLPEHVRGSKSKRKAATKAKTARRTKAKTSPRTKARSRAKPTKR